jgi:DNA primase
VRKVITMLLHHPQLAAGAGNVDFLARLDMPGTDLLGELLELLGSHPNLNTGGIVEHFRSQDAGRHLAKLAGQEPPVLSQGLETEFSDCVAKLARLVDEQRYEELVRQARARSLTTQEESEFRRLVARSKQPEDGLAEGDPRRKEG